MITTSRFMTTLVAVATALGAGSAQALDPMPVKLGPIEFIPTIGLAAGYDSNIEQAPSGQEISSASTRLTPKLLLRAQERLNRYEFSYRGLYEFFSADAMDDRFNHYLLATSHLEFDSRNRLDLKASFDQIQDVQNATNRQYNQSGNRSNTYLLGGVYGFGAQTATFNFDLGLDYKWVRYLNNLDTGTITLDQEYNSPAVRGILYYRLGPKTQLLAQVGYAHFDYVWSGSDLDSDNLTYLAGVTWQATAKTRGTIKVGYEQKDFRDKDIDNPDLPVWDVALTWTPVERAEITFSTRSFIAEGSAQEDYTDTQEYRLAWNHKWLERFASNLFASYMNQKYQGGSYDGRDDKTSHFGLRLTYNLRRWVDVDLEANYKQDDSTLESATYDRNWFFLNFTFSL